MSPKNTSMNQNEPDRAIERGRILANPPPGDEVVISGIAGRFPDSDDVAHFMENLSNKVDLVTSDNRRWEATHPEIPHRTGKMNHINKVDPGFFGIHHKQTTTMDPMARLFIEKAVEALFDAGVNPAELQGTKTGVFVGCCYSESEKNWFYDRLESKNYAVTGCTRSMLANRVSYYLKLQGPSYVVDTACSSSLHAFEQAYRAIREGQCDSALVGGTNLCLHPFVSLQFARLGVLSKDGICKSFDIDANGYARSEAVAVVYLQRARDARRLYAQVLHAKINCDGYKEQGITYPSGPVQKRLLDEFYQECNVDPSTISFVEAHGTGTKVGDPEEVSAIDEVFCTGRDKPLLIGSVKSNIGHTEPASGLCSVAKVILAMESGYILPNIYYKNPRQNVKALKDGRAKVVVEKTPWQDDNGLVGINSFGFGGANCHVLLRWNCKTKINHGLPKDDLPRLVCVSGRTEDSVVTILDQLKGRKLDAELVRLYHDIFKYNIESHIYRGYALFTKSGEISRSLTYYGDEKRPLCLVFGGYDPAWITIGRQLFAFPLFAASLQKLHKALSAKRINVTELVVGDGVNESSHEAILAFVALQLVLVGVLKELDLQPDFVAGQSVGAIAAAYCDGSLTLEQAIAVAYHVTMWLKDVANVDDVVASVRLAPGKVLPKGLEILDKISEEYVIVAGSASSVKTLKNSAGVEYREHRGKSFGLHQKASSAIGGKLLGQLKQVIPQPKKSSPKRLPSVEIAISPQFFVDVLTAQGNTSDLVASIRSDFVILEMGRKQLKEALKESHPTVAVLRFVEEDESNDAVALLNMLGRLYEQGLNPQLERLYPNIQYPVARGTPMISPLVKWDHSKDWFVTHYKTQEQIKSGERIFSMQLKEDDWSFMAGHTIDGRNLFPATGYLHLVWETLSMMVGMMLTDMKVTFENVKFLRATTIPKDGKLEMLIIVQRGSGNFEVVEGGSAVVTGRVYLVDEEANFDVLLSVPNDTNGDELLPLKQKDIYKELKLRGYNYSGLFKSLVECDNSATKGLIQWTGNWIAFMDNMLQMKILEVDTRSLYVPTSIQMMTIDAKKHLEYTLELGDDPKLPVYVHKDANIIRCGAIEIRGLNASSITRRRPLGEPVLESYQFVPNVNSLALEQSLRVNMQLVLENSYSVKVKVVEVIDDETPEGIEPLGPIVHQVLGDQPLIQPEITVVTKREIEVANAQVQDRNLSSESDCAVVIVAKAFSRPQLLKEAFGALKPGGFVLSREASDFEKTVVDGGEIQIVTAHALPGEKLIAFRKLSDQLPAAVVDVGTDGFDWLPLLQDAMKSAGRVVAYAQRRPLCGIVGLINCVRREPGGDKVQCVFVLDETAPPFDLRADFYAKQLRRNLAVNVFKDGKWGTYRHLLIDELFLVESEHCYVNVTVRGDLSSLRWIEGPLTSKSVMEPEKSLVNIYYVALNFRDVMTATGRISADVITMDRTAQECVQGIEFAGRDQRILIHSELFSSGKRVMGMVSSGAMATLLTADSNLLWELPERWTMEDAATVPVVYGTVYYALFLRGQIQRGESILIHAGSGGVGQAAISVCLYHGCEVFTTVGTKEKREFIKRRFPQIDDSHIGNSRDTTFEQMVYEQTKGRGVDLVLNSLADDKLQASVRCLARSGRFLEIGKFDLASDNPINLQLFEKEASFHGVMLDRLFIEGPNMKKVLSEHLMEGINNGSVKPLPRNVFAMEEIEEAFRFMGAGKHMGKVLVKVREEEPERNVLPTPVKVKGIPRYFCNSEMCHVIAGGLGGFGLELADWLVLRGCRKLLLTSRSGVKNGYQDSRIRTWKYYGTLVEISTADITTRKGCQQVIDEANALGPVEAIFNLAVVLQDSILENQNVEKFVTSFGPKAFATKHLDEVSRVSCPHLRDFVVFSSVSCGRGNAGQTNYGMANSVMERICEKRKTDGFPALAIEWGAIGEVGLVAELQEDHTELEIGGTLQQRISSCLETLDVFLRQNHPVVSSMVVAEKRSFGSADNVVECVAGIMGIRNLKIISLHSTLAELGMDSMMAVEIKQSLEREFEVFLTPQDIRGLTFAKLQEIHEERQQDSNKTTTKPEMITEGIELLLRNIGPEELANVAMIRLPSLVEEGDDDAPNAFLIPGIEGGKSIYEKAAANLLAHAYCLQICYQNHKDSLQDMALDLLPHVEKVQDKSKPCTIIAYSFGCTIALELMAALERKSYTVNAMFVDGSPEMMNQLLNQQLRLDSEATFETTLLCAMMILYMPTETVIKYKDAIYKCNSFEERLAIVLENSPADVKLSREYQRDLAVGFYKRIKAVADYTPSFGKLKRTSLKLYRAAVQSAHNLPDDHNLSGYVEHEVQVQVLDGNHVTVLENPNLWQDVNKALASTAPPGGEIREKVALMGDNARIRDVKVKQI